MMVELIAPHGGKLVNRLAEGEVHDALRGRIDGLPSVRLKGTELSDLELLGIGGFSPLDGYMCERDYRSVLKERRLADGVVWTIPITISATPDEARHIGAGKEVALVDASGKRLGIIEVEEIYRRNKEEEAKAVFGTADAHHPGVARLYETAEITLGGRVTLLERPRHDDFKRYRLEPAQSRELFRSKGWETVVGFQTRNPVHRAHEYIQKCALEICDGLLLHPLVGETKKDDIPAEVRMHCYEVLLEGYYPKERIALVVLPAAMRYAGPMEAIFHSIMRKNYGCTHFIVGRDHAGVGDYYGPYDAQHIFQEFTEEELGIRPLFFDNAFYCKCCQSMASVKTCPHDESEHVYLSGTKVRELLKEGKDLPSEFSRPEVVAILREYYERL
jgi:sulfate adenylyltransferase